MPARKALGDQTSAQPFDRYTASTPAAAAVRNIAPRLPGSWIASSNTQNCRLFLPGVGVLIKPSTPVGCSTGDSESKSVSLNTRRGASGKRFTQFSISASLCFPVFSATNSGVPPASANAFNKCTPSSKVWPLLRRSRADEAIFLRCL